MRGFREQQKQNQATRELLLQKIAALEQELEPEEGKSIIYVFSSVHFRIFRLLKVNTFLFFLSTTSLF